MPAAACGCLRRGWRGIAARRRRDFWIARRRHDGSERAHPLRKRNRQFLGDHPAHRRPHQMCRLDAEHVHQADDILRHVEQLVGRGHRNLQEPQLEQFDRGQALAAGHLAGLADIAIVEPDDAKPARGELPAEIVVPMDHLGAQPHDQQHRFRAGFAEDLVAKLDAIGAGDLRRLMGEYVHFGFSLKSVLPGFYGTVSCTAEGLRTAGRLTNRPRDIDRRGATVWYDSKTGEGLRGTRRQSGAPMADKSNDPVAMWQNMIGEMEKGFNAFANQAMASPEFSKVVNQVGGASAGAQKQLGDLMEKYLVGMNLPSRAQMVSMAERLQSIEGQLNEIKALLYQVHNNSGAPAGGPAAASRPPRTKRPPPAGGEQK